jgi:flagellar protein FlaG
MMEQVSAETRGVPLPAPGTGKTGGGAPREPVHVAQQAKQVKPAESAVPEARTPAEAAQAAEKQQEAREEARVEVASAFEDLNQMMERFHKAIRFEVFEDSGDVYAQIIDTNTEEVLKSIPSEEALETMNRINQVLGMFIDAEV